MDQYPLPFFKNRISLLLPRVLFPLFIIDQNLHIIWYFKTIRHGFKFIKKSFLTCILDKIKRRNFLITSMIQFTNLHSDLCWKTALNTQTKHCDVSSLASAQFFHFLSESIPMSCITTIWNKNNSNWSWFLHSY